MKMFREIREIKEIKAPTNDKTFYSVQDMKFSEKVLSDLEEALEEIRKREKQG